MSDNDNDNLVKKCLFQTDAYMVSYPTWSKNIGCTLLCMLLILIVFNKLDDYNKMITIAIA